MLWIAEVFPYQFWMSFFRFTVGNTWVKRCFLWVPKSPFTQLPQFVFTWHVWAYTKMVNNTFLQHFYLFTRHCSAAVHWTEAKTWSWWKEPPAFSSINSPKQSTSRHGKWAAGTYKMDGEGEKATSTRRSTLSCRNSPFQGQVKPVTRLTSSKAAELQVPNPCLQHYHCKTTGSGGIQDQSQNTTLL